MDPGALSSTATLELKLMLGNACLSLRSRSTITLSRDIRREPLPKEPGRHVTGQKSQADAAMLRSRRHTASMARRS